MISEKSLITKIFTSQGIEINIIMLNNTAHSHQAVRVPCISSDPGPKNKAAVANIMAVGEAP